MVGLATTAPQSVGLGAGINIWMLGLVYLAFGVFIYGMAKRFE